MNIIHDDESQAGISFEPAGLGFHFQNSDGGISSIKSGASERRPAAVVNFGQSVSPKNPFLSRCESTLASDASNAESKLFFRHFQRKNSRRCLRFQGGKLRDFQG